MSRPLRLVVLGLSLSSSWGNGHATTYRALLSAFAARGHEVLFFERDVPWYAKHRDLPEPDFCRLRFYRDLADLSSFKGEVEAADAVVVGSYVPDGVAAGRWAQETATGLVAFYDIDTPVTLSKLQRGDFEYLSPELIPTYGLYLSFTGGPTLERLERFYGSPMARPLFCSVDARSYHPVETDMLYDLGYLGTYSGDRQPMLERLLLEPARRLPDLHFAVAGPQYPSEIRWPDNVRHLDHVAPRDHSQFYSACRFTLNVTRADMVSAGHSPSVRLFEAAACGTPIVSDVWEGIEEVLAPGREILLARNVDDVVAFLRDMPDDRRTAVALAARRRVLAEHTAEHRAAELEHHLLAALDARQGTNRPDPLLARQAGRARAAATNRKDPR